MPYCPKIHLLSTKTRAFSVTALALWNMPPMNIIQAAKVLAFRSLLKTHLFPQGFRIKLIY